jgi:ADP-ribosylglycohydrolase
MRVSPVGFAFHDETTVIKEARKTAEITHSHPEGIKGAQATALVVFLAKQGVDKASIRERIVEEFGYDLSRSIDDIRPHYSFDISCQGTLPEAIVAFLDSTSFEDAIRNAISLGGDSDTLACITGGIAEAFYKEIPAKILREVKIRLTKDLWSLTDHFYRKHGIPDIVEQLDTLDDE